MTPDFLIAILRTALQMLGAYLMGRGIVDEGSWESISGGLLSGASVLWMLYARWNTRKVAVRKDAAQ